MCLSDFMNGLVQEQGVDLTITIVQDNAKFVVDEKRMMFPSTPSQARLSRWDNSTREGHQVRRLDSDPCLTKPMRRSSITTNETSFCPGSTSSEPSFLRMPQRRSSPPETQSSTGSSHNATWGNKNTGHDDILPQPRKQTQLKARLENIDDFLLKTKRKQRKLGARSGSSNCNATWDTSVPIRPRELASKLLLSPSFSTSKGKSSTPLFLVCTSAMTPAPSLQGAPSA